MKVNKIAMKSSSKNLSFGVDVKLHVPPLMYKIKTNNVSGVRNLALVQKLSLFGFFTEKSSQVLADYLKIILYVLEIAIALNVRTKVNF